jgi:hypothetical protein
MISAVKIKAIFNVHGVWEAIDPSVNVDPKRNNIAIAYLYQAMPEELFLQVAQFNRAKEIWVALKARYVGVERVQQARLESPMVEFEASKMKDGEPIEDFTGRISGIVSNENSLGAVVEDKKTRKKVS